MFSLKKLLFSIALCWSFLGFSQVDTFSQSTKISILTCGPGTELYSTFGHSAFRVWDPMTQKDYVYNYGTFDFTAPNFYLNFVKGKLIFKLDKQEFPRFLFEYQYEKRWVTEHILNLTPEQKTKLINFLENNALPENREYKYDFFFDNCATKILSVLKEVYKNDINFKSEHLKTTYTFRELLDQKLSANSWASVGIDFALGSKIDKKATPLEHSFLPDYTLLQLKNTTLNSKSLINSKRTVLKTQESDYTISFLGTPLFVFSVILLFTLYITYLNVKNKSWSKWLDVLLLSITGLAGVILLILWFATEHTATAKNYNLLWAVPINIVPILYLTIKKQWPNWLSKYCLFLLLFLVNILIINFVGIQKFHPIFIPLLLSLAARYVFLWQRTKLT